MPSGEKRKLEVEGYPDWTRKLAYSDPEPYASKMLHPDSVKNLMYPKHRSPCILPSPGIDFSKYSAWARI